MFASHYFVFLHMKRLILSAVALCLLSITALPRTDKHIQESFPRIFWDISTQQEIFPLGNYARIISLLDGRLIAVAEAGGGISCRYSKDGGHTWTPPRLIVRSADKVPYAVPDIIQLSDGTIIVGYNPRPSQPPSEDRRFGIRVVRSIDNGTTWSDPIYVYDASHLFRDGCWEPSFLELPGGEVQLYFANENNFRVSDEQEISMCRSFDKGKTWSDPVRISYRAGYRDGMPVAILTENDEIVVIIEDNGQPGRNGFRATTVRSSLCDNWCKWADASTIDRQIIFADDADKTYISAAPYLRKLKNGYTIASWQGDKGARAGMGENHYDMFVAVGDKDARNFKGITEPFMLPVEMHALWNSVAVSDNGDVFAIASIGGKGKPNAISIIKGRAIDNFHVGYGKPNETDQIVMGTRSRKRSSLDFWYDKNKLYLKACINDADTSINRDLTMQLQTGTKPSQSIYSFTIAPDNTLKVCHNFNGKKNYENNIKAIKHKVSYSNDHLELELAIPFKFLKAKTSNAIRCNITIRHGNETDTIPAIAADNPETWPRLVFCQDQ